MAAAPGLELRWLITPEDVPATLRTALTACWRDVANAGGAVGFAQQLPVTEDVVASAVGEVVSDLGTPGCRLLVATQAGDLAGWLVLATNASPVLAHWGRVTRVQTAVTSRGVGVARALLTELHRSAREDLGLELLRLEVRGGLGLEAFYERFGWRVTGCWPGALQIAPDDRRDEVLMTREL